MSGSEGYSPVLFTILRFSIYNVYSVYMLSLYHMNAVMCTSCLHNLQHSSI